MIIIGLGANLPSRFGPPQKTLYEALKAMALKDIWPVQISRVWKTAPVPPDPHSPWYYNAVAQVKTDLSAENLLLALLEIEKDFGRVRTIQNAPRLIDLDVVLYDGLIMDNHHLTIPHPRMAERAFVLLPLQDIAAGDWRHPVTGMTLQSMVSALPEGQQAMPMEDGWNEI